MAPAASPSDWYNSLPPVSKAWGTACFACTLLSQFGLVDLRNLYLNWALVKGKFQVWRLLTNFCFLGKFSFPFLMRMMMIARYGVFLEQHTFAGRIADFVWMVLLCVGVLLPIPVLVPSIQIPFFGPSLVFTLLYLWSRENPNANTSIMGMITMKAFYLPWGMLGMGLVMGQDPVPDLLGILAGHLYYFLAVLHPRTGGRRWIRTPEWVRAMCYTLFGVRSAPAAVPAAAAARGTAAGAAGGGNTNTAGGGDGTPRRRVFQGRGQRLGGN